MEKKLYKIGNKFFWLSEKTYNKNKSVYDKLKISHAEVAAEEVAKVADLEEIKPKKKVEPKKETKTQPKKAEIKNKEVKPKEDKPKGDEMESTGNGDENFFGDGSESVAKL